MKHKKKQSRKGSAMDKGNNPRLGGGKKSPMHPIPMTRHIHINSSYKSIATQCHARWQRRSVQLMLMTGGSSWVSSTFQNTPKRKKREKERKKTKSRQHSITVRDAQRLTNPLSRSSSKSGCKSPMCPDVHWRLARASRGPRFSSDLTSF